MQHVSSACNILTVELARHSRGRYGQVTAIGRGRHTTRHVAFLQVAGGLLADTPGFNQPSLTALQPADLPTCFPEIRDRLGRSALAPVQSIPTEGATLLDGC